MNLSLRLFFLLIGILTVNGQTNSGDLEVYLNNYIDNVPGSSGDDYSAPNGTDLINWESAIRDILAGNIVTARTTATSFNYIITEYTDINHLPGQVYYVLEEDSPLSNHWGTYVFNSSPLRDNLILQTTHARYDTNTGDEAVYSFTRLSAKSIFIQGTHRCNHNSTTSCDGSTSACDSTSKPFSISDVAHNVSTVFQKTTEIVAEDQNTVFVQLHGFSQQPTDPDIILSNGTDQAPSGSDNVILLRDELLNVDASLTFKIPHVDIGWTRLIATTNTQGRYLNQSNSPCNTAAISSTGRFVHMEQAFSLRSNSTGWDKIYVALSNAFSNGCATDNTPPVIDCQDLIVQLDNAGNGTLSQAFLNSLATDDCTTALVTASKTNFVCTDVLNSPANKMVITGIVEGDISATNVKAVEVTVLQDIQDLSEYGIGSANNGGGTDGQEFTFPVMSATAGEKFLITRDNTIFNAFFGFSADFVDTVAIFFNGDDAIELFFDGNVIDRYGEPNVDGTGEVWEYLNGWAYRITDTHPDGSIFVSENWIYGGVDANTGATNNTEANPQFPVESYQILPNSHPVRVEATDTSGNISSCFINIIVDPFTATFASGSWDVTPGSGAKALFQDSYNTATDGDVTACSCEIESGNIVTVAGGGFLDIQGNILVDGILNVEHQGSVVQRSATATATNGGSITVSKLTPVLGPKGFMILGNPMTGETREGVYGAGRLVASHITGNFIPNGAVSSGLENFADDNGNNWAIHSGALTAGEGYLVKPQAPGNPPIGGAFPLDYSLGTLNSGDVNYNLLFNTSRLDSPNMLGNPYASAIDIDLFLGANVLLDAVYYWEHITAPVNNFPGFNQLNFNIGDLSAYNQGSGGVMAPNGTTIPTQFMASGQGFGVKALGGGIVTFTNAMRVATPNTDYRSNDSDRQRIWLDLKNEMYNLKSNMLVAFTEGATDGFEGLYDSRRFDSSISMYSVLDTDEQLCIQGRTAFNDEQVIALGFATMVEELQTYSISIHQIEGVDLENATVYLEDHVLNISTNISEGNYTFTANKGEQLNRFKLVFQERVLGTNDVALEMISLLPNPTQDMVTITSPTAMITGVEVMDVQGRIISSEKDAGTNQFALDMSRLNTAMYFVRIHTSQGSLIKRVIKE